MGSHIELAKRTALYSPCRHRVGAVIAAGPRVLATRSNSRRNSPRVDFHHATFHAEEAAVRRVRNPAGTVIYVARVNAAGEPVMARPCERCQRLLAAVGIVGAYFTTWDGSVDYLDIARSRRAPAVGRTGSASPALRDRR
ncbi:hypothetical protein [Streptomyces sp. NPDC047981]|uniref:hypothetical protein n=1 Tax=Streptomyces sp. NPDC047981 TaxID=3154610 RepID=UPI0034443CCE